MDGSAASMAVASRRLPNRSLNAVYLVTLGGQGVYRAGTDMPGADVGVCSYGAVASGSYSASRRASTYGGAVIETRQSGYRRVKSHDLTWTEGPKVGRSEGPRVADS